MNIHNNEVNMNTIAFSYIIAGLSFVLYINSCFCGFVFDDISAILNNQDVTGKSPISSLMWNDYWGTSMTEERSHKSYRPLTVLTFRLNYLLFGNDPCSYHVVNVLLQCIVAVLVYKLFLLLTKLCFETRQSSKAKLDRKAKGIKKFNHSISPMVDSTNDEKSIAVIATLLFVVHPIHTEAVSNVVGRAELLSAIFFILAILCFTRLTVKSFALSLIFCTFAVASKEQGIMAIPVCVFLDIIIINKFTLDEFCLLLVMFVMSPKQTKNKLLLLRTLLFVLFGSVLLYWRFYVMQGQLPHFTAFDNPAAASDFPARQLTFNYLLPVNVWLLLNPSCLLCDWTMGTIPLVENFWDVRNVATVVFWTFYFIFGSSVFFHDPISKLSSVSIAIMSFSFLPASNLLFSVGFVIAERVLYVPSIGFCLLISAGIWKLKSKLNSKRVITGFLVILMFSHSLKIFLRNMEWRTELDLFKSALKITQRNAKVWNNIGHAYENDGSWDQALTYFEQATLVQPDDLGAFMNVARAHEKLGDKRKAELNYRKAKSLLPKSIRGSSYQTRVAPSSLQVFIKLANLLKEDDSKLVEVEGLYQEAIRMRPSFVDAHINRGEILLKMNRPKEALLSYHNALRYAKNKSDIYFNIGVLHSQMGNISGAVEAYTYSILDYPKHVKSLFNSAVIFHDMREPSLLQRAKSRTEKVLSLEPDNLMAKTLLGSIFMDMNEYNKAIQIWTEVLEVEPSERTTLFNLALIYSKIKGRYEDCLKATEQLLKFYPDHQKGLLLYGDVMLNYKKNITEAQRTYTHLINLYPNSVEANHNYCVALFQQHLLVEAESCLQRVYRMAPQESYIQQNLLLVRRQMSLNEINERKKKNSQSNFKSTPIAESPTEEETEPYYEESEDEDDEEVIYVANEPILNEDQRMMKEARKARENLGKLKGDSVEEKLAEATDSVKKLKKIRDKMKKKTTQKCSTDVSKAEDLRKNALKVLDELEANL